jgi:hypothetical protein
MTVFCAGIIIFHSYCYRVSLNGMNSEIAIAVTVCNKLFENVNKFTYREPTLTNKNGTCVKDNFYRSLLLLV